MVLSTTRRSLLGAFLLAILVVTPAVAQDEPGWWGSYYKPGNLAFSAGAGVEFYSGGFGLDLYPGAEIIVTKFRPGNAFAIDIGAGAKGIVGFWNAAALPSRGYLVFGGGPFVSAHLGFRGFSFPFAEYLEPLDIFTAVGVNFVAYGLTGDWSSSIEPNGGLKISWSNGFNYFLTDNIALSLHYNYLANWSSTSVGIVLKVGDKEELGERPDFPDMQDVERSTAVLGGNLAYMQFASQYWLILGFGGFIADDESFEVGDGVRWWMALPDEDDVNEIEYTRALLHENPDGSKWWRAEFESGAELSDFEYLVDGDGNILMLRYEDLSSGNIVTYEPDDPGAWWGEYEDSVRNREELEEMSEGTERIRVPAGTFRANRVTAMEESYEYTWWYTEEVPGLLVKLEGYEENTLIVEGELREVQSGVTSPWGPAW